MKLESAWQTLGTSAIGEHGGRCGASRVVQVSRIRPDRELGGALPIGSYSISTVSQIFSSSWIITWGVKID